VIKPRIQILSPAQWAVATALCFALLLAAFNILNHKVVLLESAERDNYFLRADELLRGESYHDPYRPPLYAVLTAAFSFLLRLNTFAAANLISSASIGALVGMSFLLASFFVRPLYALLTQFLVAINVTVVGQGLSASTDALAAALCLGTLLCVVARAFGRPVCSGFRSAIVLGVMFALALLTRYTAAFLLPVLVLGLWQGDGSHQERLKMLAVATASALVVLMPWLVYNTVHNGSPLASENWRNFAFAVYGGRDWRYFETASVGYNGYLDILVQNPLGVLMLWGRNIRDMILSLLVIDLGSPLLALLLPIGALLLGFRRSSGGSLLLYVVGCVSAFVLTFTHMPRLMLAAIPALILIATVGLQGVLDKQWMPWFAHPLVLVFILLWPFLLLFSLLTNFRQSQPIDEVETLNHFVAERAATSKDPVRIVSTYPYLAYFAESPERVEHASIPLQLPEFYRGDDFLQMLLGTVYAHNAEYVLLSDGTTHGFFESGLGDASLPPCLVLQQKSLVASGAIRIYRNECAPGDGPDTPQVSD
jgi:4-amino-4-deoxy-L-arabinose transferase-like glycosyltransferase